MSTLFSNKKRKRVKIANEDDVPRNNLQDATAGDKTVPGQRNEEFSNAFSNLGLGPALVAACKALGFKKPTPVQKTVIPALLGDQKQHILALAATGSGKTASFALPIIQHLMVDPYGIYALVLSPTRELAQQVNEQILALGAKLDIRSCLVTGGDDMVRQACELSRLPHIVVATPGRLAELLRGPNPPRLRHLRFVVLDEADRLLSPGGFERDIAQVLVTTKRKDCQTLLFSATMTRSLDEISNLASGGKGRLPLKRFNIVDESKPSTLKEQTQENQDAPVVAIPSGLKQQYIFMPSQVRDSYLVAAIRILMANGGRRGTGDNDGDDDSDARADSSGWNMVRKYNSDGDDDDTENAKARSAIVFVSTCERAARMEGMLFELGVDCVALHSILSQDRRRAALGKFKSQHVRVLVATDVASRGLDIPEVDLVLNAELPRKAADYIHRVGRTARAGRRGLAVSLVGEGDVALVHAAEKLSGRPLEKCGAVTDKDALRMMNPVAKATRLTKVKMAEVGFDDLVKKHVERRARDRKERRRAERAAAKAAGIVVARKKRK
mmetsp:Transcript_7305/g.10784  ORF Transcript_7305/g.10784 Transcript_7305/m.10784 type:complete len:554 (-) Transcript_7305:29-1690(-)|eukprot:CAMPEP_0196819232 /NCGR_PEP_ID=MMETSP1362-20130617/69644_1 /TAXON_ID=163516 /ORGANISM="Leptocylindrus danicus, Strain CCMP1856" /LENGTH=553 /DNA_ID=CAMNT_0042197637 /DNA_START=75 /DNA_END=1736 /DNA_ORIENTATION=+